MKTIEISEEELAELGALWVDLEKSRPDGGDYFEGEMTLGAILRRANNVKGFGWPEAWGGDE